jgi:hypothetical protein
MKLWLNFYTFFFSIFDFKFIFKKVSNCKTKFDLNSGGIILSAYWISGKTMDDLRSGGLLYCDS